MPRRLEAKNARNIPIEKKSYVEAESVFRFDFNEDQMAVEKLREGISKFAADAETLKNIPMLTRGAMREALQEVM